MKVLGILYWLLGATLLLPFPAWAQNEPPPPPAEAMPMTSEPPHHAEPHPQHVPPAPVVRMPHASTEAPPPAPIEAANPISVPPATDREVNLAPKPSLDADADTEAQPVTVPSLASVFTASFMRWALLAGLIVAGTCAYVGVYVVLKRIVFVGAALAEVSSAGVALAILLGFNPFIGAVALMFVGIGLFSVRWSPRRVSQESFIGIGWAVASALGVLLIAKSAKGEAHMHDLLFGNILTVDPVDVRNTAIGMACVLLIHALFTKEFLFVSFDADTASAMGYRARSWDLLLYATIGLAIAFSIHTVGVLMAFSALVLPPVTALLLTRRMRSALITSVILGVIPVPIGLYLSFARDLPSSATIVAIMFAILLVGGGVARLRAH
jgi:ABC-type Mn2+/Zn2+ transport system permease subunit